MHKITKKLPLGSGTPRLLIFILCLLLLFNLLLCVLVALVTMKHAIKISAKPKRPFSSFIPLWVTWFRLHYLKIQQPPYLFLISFSNEVSLSYPNSPPAGRGRFTMSAWVATRTTRSGFFSLPPKAEGRKQAISHLPRCGEQTSTLPRWGGVLGLGCLTRWMRLVHFACRLANLCLLIGVTYKVTRRSRPGQRWNEPISWASRKAAQKWTRSNHRAWRSFSDLPPNRPYLHGEGRSSFWLGDALSKTRASCWMQHSTEMAQKGNSCRSHQQRASHLWQCLKWKHEEGGGKSGGTLKGISPIYFAVTCFSRKELTAEFYISPGKAASFFLYEKKKIRLSMLSFPLGIRLRYYIQLTWFPFFHFWWMKGNLFCSLTTCPLGKGTAAIRWSVPLCT